VSKTWKDFELSIAFRFLRLTFVTLLAISQSVQPGLADDWRQFRGPQCAGVVATSKLPLKWSETENLRWKAELPGPGSSSPVVLGDRVFVTCYSGYGVPKANGGDLKALQRHLVCVDRKDGKIRWTKTVAAELPEDNYQGYISEHGYASNTSVVDEDHVYCFFGKSGVLAFDLDGKPVWKANVGKESSNRRWGSGSSLILYKDTVIVNAAEESQTIRALDKKTGKEVWKASGAALELAYGTPTLVTSKDNRADLVVAVPGEVWGINPDTGKIRWFEEHSLTGNISPSVISSEDTVFIFGGFRSAGSLALRLAAGDGKAKPKLEWSSRTSSYVATPVLFEGHLFWIDDRGQAFCINAKTGEQVYRERVTELESGGRPVYASPVVAGDTMIVPSRWNGVLVLPAAPKYAVLAQNRFTGDESDFNGTPAISNDELFLRSNRFLYCVADMKKNQ
jgi:hypothetical protein